MTVALLGRTSLKGSRKVAADNVLGAFYVKFPARGRLKGSGQRFRYVLASNTFIGNAEIAYVLKIGRRSLSIVGNGTLAGSPVVVKIQGNRRR